MVGVVIETQSRGENCLNWNYSLAATDRAVDTMNAAVPARKAVEGKLGHQNRPGTDCCHEEGQLQEFKGPGLTCRS